MDQVNTIIVGAGVVGLAIAARLAQTNEVVVLDEAGDIGQGISSRNSEVIHAGIYYPEGSLKAKLCVRGKRLLYDYCKTRHVPFKNVGKVIVATSDAELEELDRIEQRAIQNDVPDLKRLKASQISQLEPQVHGVEGLLSPSTGIVSAHELMNALSGDVAISGGHVVLQSKVIHISCSADRFELKYKVAGEVQTIACEKLVVAAGLGAQTLGGSICFLKEGYEIPDLYLCRGTYFTYSGRPPFQRLIYPVPEANTAGLGIHSTIDLGGQVKFGPDVEYVNEPDYSIPAQVPESYVAAIAKYFPGVQRDKLQPGYAGIRPKLSAPGEPAADFRIDAARDHGVEGLVMLFGIESPGLTASLAIAEHVEQSF